MDDVDHPDQVQFGIRYQPHDRISLEADLVWTNWSTVEEQTVEFDEAYAGDALGAILTGNYPSREIVHDRDWEDTRQIRVGVEWKATDILTLRGGYFYDPTPIPDDTFDITWPDADKKTYSLGFGLDLNENWVVDGVFQYTTTEQDRSIGGESENLNHAYGGNDVNLDAEGEIFGYGLTVSYKF
jgi:long-chain fatty acid transport protein